MIVQANQDPNMKKRTPNFGDLLIDQQNTNQQSSNQPVGTDEAVDILKEGLTSKEGDGLNANILKLTQVLKESIRVQNQIAKKVDGGGKSAGRPYLPGYADWERGQAQKMGSMSYWLGVTPESRGLLSDLVRRREARQEFVKSAMNMSNMSQEEATEKFNQLNRVRGKRQETEELIEKLKKQGFSSEDIRKYRTAEGPNLFELQKRYAQQEQEAVSINAPAEATTDGSAEPVVVADAESQEKAQRQISDLETDLQGTAARPIPEERFLSEEEQETFNEIQKHTNLLGSMDIELKGIHETLKKCCEQLKEASETLAQDGPLSDILTALTGGAAAAAAGGVVLSAATVAAIVAGIGAALWPSSTSSTSWDPNYNPNDPNQTGPNFPQIPGGKQPYFGPGPATAPPGKSNTLNPTALTQEDKDKQLAAIDLQIKQTEVDLQNDPSNQGKQDQLKALKVARDITAAQKATPAPLVSTPASRISQTKKENIEEAAPYLQRASEISGMDLDTLSNFTNLESGFNENALTPLDSNGVVPKGVADDRKRMSSAHGYGQFLNDTWAEKVKQYGSKYGVKGTGKNGEITDEDAFKVREDKMVQAGMLAEYAQEGVRLSKKYGLQDNDASIYAHHNLGPGGAEKLFKALQNNPDAEIISIIGEKAAANNPSLYKRGMTARQAYENLGKKVREGQKSTEVLKASLQNQQTAHAAQPAPQQSPDAVSALHAAEGENIHQRAMLEMDLQYAQRDGDQAKVDKLTKELELNQQQRDALISAQKVHQEQTSKPPATSPGQPQAVQPAAPAQSKAEPIDARSAGFFGTGETVADRLAAEESWGPDKDWATEAKPVDYKPEGVVPQAALNLEQKMLLAADKPKTAAEQLEDEFDKAIFEEEKNIAEYDIQKNQKAKQKAEAIRQRDLQGLPQVDVGERSFQANPLSAQPLSSAEDVYKGSVTVSDAERDLKASSAASLVNAPTVNNVSSQNVVNPPGNPRNTDSAWQRYSNFAYGWGVT